MQDDIRKLQETMARLEQLLVRFEIDTAARLHVVDYQMIIAQLCDNFHEQMTGLMAEASAERVGESMAQSSSISHAGSRGVSRSRHG